MKKPDNVKIVLITSSANDSAGFSIFGLGDDQEIYAWSYAMGSWIVNKQIKNDTKGN